MTNSKEVLEHSDEQVRKRILEMKPGRQLDMIVAENVMEWKDCSLEGWRTEVAYGKPSFFDDDDPRVRIPDYSSDISAAWEVWEHDRSEGWSFELNYFKGAYTAMIVKIDEQNGYEYLAQARSKFAAEAICKCRLLAMEGIQE